MSEPQDTDIEQLGIDLGLICPDCKYPTGSFACKIRHLSINTGAAKAAND